MSESVECPRCGRGAGQPCVTARGNEMPYTHASRRVATVKGVDNTPNPWKHIRVPLFAPGDGLPTGVTDEDVLRSLPRGTVIRFPRSENVAVKISEDEDKWLVGGVAHACSSAEVLFVCTTCDVIWIPKR